MTKRRGLWTDALFQMRKDRLAVVCLGIVVSYALIALLTQFGWIASPWNLEVGSKYQAPTWSDHRLWLGADLFGRSVLYKVLHGTRVAMSVGLITSLIAIPIGVTLGAIAGYFGGKIDDLIVWFYSTVSSVPSILLLLAIAFVLGKGLTTVYLAVGLTSWVGFARVIRGEFMKHKNREYVMAANGLGATQASRIFKHILPNVSHQVVLAFSIQFMSAIRSEVILSYLGLGVQGQPSWGIMIDDARNEILQGYWWQGASATMAIFFILFALNIFGDALRDALDPKIR